MKTPKPPKPRKAWFIVSPGGIVQPWTGRSTRQESVIDFTMNAWGTAWEEFQAKGYRCVRLSITG